MSGTSMTPKEFRAAIKKLGLTPSSKKTAEALGLSVRQVQRYASGEQDAPPAIIKLLAALIALKARG